MKRRISATIMMLPVLVFLGLPVYSAEATATATQTEEWVKVKEGKGIVSYGKPGSKNPVKTVYAVGIVNASVPVIESLLRDVECHNKYVHMVSEAKKIDLPGKRNTIDLFYEYCRLGMPWPAWDRDAIGSAQFLYNKASGELRVIIKGVKADDVKPNPKTIRMPVTNLSFKLVPKGPQETEVTYAIEADPAIALAPFILDMLFKTLAYNTIVNMREMVKQEKYSKATSVITTTPF
ncbi:MAG: hypothetical protein KA369_10610 [Spirochaetes bacterium]|nr:hypothetical protein [Spirochaetota bacterium]